MGNYDDLSCAARKAEKRGTHMTVGGQGGVYLWPTVSRPLPFAGVTGPALLRPAEYRPHSTQHKKATNRNSVHSLNSNQPYLQCNHHSILKLATMHFLPSA